MNAALGLRQSDGMNLPIQISLTLRMKNLYCATRTWILSRDHLSTWMHPTRTHREIWWSQANSSGEICQRLMISINSVKRIKMRMTWSISSTLQNKWTTIWSLLHHWNLSLRIQNYTMPRSARISSTKTTRLLPSHLSNSTRRRSPSPAPPSNLFQTDRSTNCPCNRNHRLRTVPHSRDKFRASQTPRLSSSQPRLSLSSRNKTSLSQYISM